MSRRLPGGSEVFSVMDRLHRRRAGRTPQIGEKTPPRAWGRLDRPYRDAVRGRNTPTGVGKTSVWSRPSLLAPKHPHGRGEDENIRRIENNSSETPPRAWGRPRAVSPRKAASRNTPTGVGKTQPPAAFRPALRKHPHGRGEDDLFTNYDDSLAETPPRAWGRPPSPT